MRDCLALLQFPFLYTVAVFIGLEVHGSDFEGISGFLYLIPLLGAPLAHRLSPALRRTVSAAAVPWLLAAGVAWGTGTYRSLHIGLWDEHSLIQAVLVLGLGLFSLLAAARAEGARDRGARTRPRHLSLSLAAVGLVHLGGYWFPFLPLFGVVVVLALAVSGESPPSPGEPGSSTPAAVLPRGFVTALFFWVGAELARIPCDYQGDPALGLTLAMLFGAASLGSLLALSRRPLARNAPLALGFASSLGAAFRPDLVTHPVNALCLGAALGFAAAATLIRRPGRSGILVMSLVFTLGMTLSSAWSAQMTAVPQGNLVFLLPALALLAPHRGRRRT